MTADLESATVPQQLGKPLSLDPSALARFLVWGMPRMVKGATFFMAIPAARTENHPRGGLHEKKVFHSVHTERFGSVVRF